MVGQKGPWMRRESEMAIAKEATTVLWMEIWMA